MPFNFNRKKFSYGAMPLLTRDVLRAQATLDYPSIAAGASADLTVTVPGAAVGDDVVVSYDSTPTTALITRAWVSAADTVTVRQNNFTASGIDQAATIYRVIVFKAY